MGWTRETVLKVAKRTGYPVVEAWSAHNAGTMGTVLGPMLHHTGTPESTPGDYPTLKVVRDGRLGLENSLAMYGIGRSGTIYCISEKISWHAGVGDWNGITDGNGYFAGIEAEGPYNTWPAAEVDSYQKLVASILIETGRGVDWAPTHAQWANPPGRKTDPSSLDMIGFMYNVQKYLNNPASLGEEELIMDKAEFISWVREGVASTSVGKTPDGRGPANLDTYVKTLYDKVVKLEEAVAALKASPAQPAPEAAPVDLDALAEQIVAKLSNRMQS